MNRMRMDACREHDGRPLQFLDSVQDIVSASKVRGWYDDIFVDQI